MKTLFLCLAAVSCMIYQGCTPSHSAQSPSGGEKARAMKPLDVRVTYLDRHMLPPGAVAEVILEDVSKMDVPSQVIARTSLQVQGGPPYALRLEYDPADIQDRHRYSLRARITKDDRLLYTSDTHVDPFSGAAGPPVEIAVKRTHTMASKPMHHAEFKNTYWKLMALGDGSRPEPAGDREMFIQFRLEENQVRGFSGCNHFVGTYEEKEGQLKIGPLASTRKMCFRGMEDEAAVLKAIQGARAYSVHKETMVLKDQDGKVLVRFESRYMQ